ncbi:MAG: hypothetical protein HY843_08195 [Bdellovibrio sp.]|nr:hypothetical protein [Bdellovibrio sp.]
MGTISEEKQLLRDIKKALNRFPKIVADKKRRYKERQKFLKETFGDLVKQLNKELKKLE